MDPTNPAAPRHTKSMRLDFAGNEVGSWRAGRPRESADAANAHHLKDQQEITVPAT